MAKIYKCPSCDDEMTTATIKEGGKSCPGCRAPLKHVIKRIEGKGGGKNHFWIIDPNRPIPQTRAEVSEARYMRITVGDNPEIWELMKDTSSDEDDPRFQIVYWDRYSSTELRCPQCNGYMHTTNAISGIVEETLCRGQEKTENGWHKCKTRTRFIFLRRGQKHEIAT